LNARFGFTIFDYPNGKQTVWATNAVEEEPTLKFQQFPPLHLIRISSHTLFPLIKVRMLEKNRAGRSKR
jgi:hypothetical protein